MRKKWGAISLKCRAYSSVGIDSDHRIVTANIKISLRTPRKQSKSSISDPLFYLLQNYNNDTHLKLVIDLLLLMRISILHPFRIDMTKLLKL